MSSGEQAANTLSVEERYARLLTKPELGAVLQKSRSSIDRLRRKRIIPWILVGGEVRFRLTDVERALARYTVKEVSI